MITETKFKSVLEDSTFKFLFYRKEFLKDFLDSYFKFIKLNKKVYLSNVFTHKHIMKDKIELKDFYTDIITTLDTEEIVILEAYTSFTKEEYAKSYSYMCRVYANQIKSGDNNYKDNKKVICINLMHGDYKKSNNMLVNRYELMNNITYKVLDNGETEMVLINLDLLSKLDYTDGNKRFIKWLRFLNAKSIEELDKISKGDDMLMKSAEYIKWYLSSDNNTCLEDKLREVEKNGRKSGIIEGKKSGIMDTAKNMLALNIEDDKITKATGLSLKELNKLKNAIN